MGETVLLWFRRDLRLTDNAAVIPVFVLDDGADGLRPLGGASKWWLDKSLRALGAELRARGSRLVVLTGVRLGEDYPRPIVERTQARARALAAFAALRQAG